MALRDLILRGRGQDVTRRGAETDPFLTLHREMNRLFDDVFRGFDLPTSGTEHSFGRGWPSIEVSETDKELKVTAELSGLEEKDVHVELENGILTIKGEKKTETEEKDRLFSAHYRSVPAAHSGRRGGPRQGVRNLQERRAHDHDAENGAGGIQSEADRH